jgi:hypothetical protein
MVIIEFIVSAYEVIDETFKDLFTGIYEEEDLQKAMADYAALKEKYEQK